MDEEIRGRTCASFREPSIADVFVCFVIRRQALCGIPAASPVWRFHGMHPQCTKPRANQRARQASLCRYRTMGMGSPVGA